jgi:hypothetical protein
MRRFFQLSVLCLAAGVLTACEPEHVLKSPEIPTAGVRFVHAVPDTGAMDFRFVDIVENSAHYAVTFRANANLYYKPARAGQRHLRIFRSGTTADVATIVVKDTVVTLEENRRYTFILWGFSRPGSNPPMRLSVIEDNPADPGAQVALRVINAGAGLNPMNVGFNAGSGACPATVTWANVPALSASAYVQVAPGTYRYCVTGGADLNAVAPVGDPGTVDIEAIPGTTVSGSAVTGIIFPRNVAGSQATSPTAPSIIFVWDRRPPTCPLC